MKKTINALLILLLLAFSGCLSTEKKKEEKNSKIYRNGNFIVTWIPHVNFVFFKYQ